MKRIILASGGLDSTVLLYQTKQLSPDTVALFFNYGQKSLRRERTSVMSVCRETPWFEIDVSDVFRNSHSSLVSTTIPITEIIRIDNHTRYESKNTNVEFRNGVLIAAAISFAMQKYPDQSVEIGYGAIRTREPFHDCSDVFVRGVDMLARWCSNGKVSVVAPFIEMGKDDVKNLALQYGVPIAQTWSCYDGKDEPCGVCPACLDRRILEV